MLAFENISVSFGAEIVLRDVNFSLANGEKIGLVGVNGAGKSTLLKVILGNISPDAGKLIISRGTRIGYMPQTVEDFGTERNKTVLSFLLSGRPIMQLEEKLTMLYKSLEPIRKNSKKVEETLRIITDKQAEFESWGGYSAQNELMDIIIGMGIDQVDLNAKVKRLSGGEKSNVFFARVLYSNPDVLLLDEPTNHLDRNSRLWIIGFLRGYLKSIIAVSHDPEFLDAFIGKVARIDEFSHEMSVYHGTYSDFLKQWATQQKTLNRAFENQEMARHKLKDFIDRMQGASGKRKRQAKSREKALDRLNDDKIVKRKPQANLKFTFSPNRESGITPIRVDSLTFGYEADKIILDKLSFHVSRGEKFVVVGQNGMGKSTLLRLLAGKLNANSGSITFDRKADIAYYTQEHEDLNMDSSPIREVLSVSGLKERVLRAILGQFLFIGEKVFQSIKTLSPGERSRLALAKIALSGANVLLLDEPINHLDPNTRKIVAEVLRQYGGTIIAVSHEIDFLEQLEVERMLVLPSGSIQYYQNSIVEQYSSQDGKGGY